MGKKLAQIQDVMKQLGGHAPDVMNSFMAFNRAVTKDGALPHKMKTIIAVALAVQTRCDYCLAIHVADALQAGASKEEILEGAYVAAAMGGGPAIAGLRGVFDALEAFSAK